MSKIKKYLGILILALFFSSSVSADVIKPVKWLNSIEKIGDVTYKISFKAINLNVDILKFFKIN